MVINFEMFSVFMSFGPGVRILHPRKAAMYMRDKFKEALDMYDV